MLPLPRLLRAPLAGLLIAFLALSCARSEREPTTVVCFGDSITLGTGLKEHAYPAVLAQLVDARVINAGVGGNTTSAGLARMDKDVLAHRPAVVVAMFGTNDSVITPPGAYRVPLEKFEANLREIITRSRAAGARVILCTPCPVVAELYHRRHQPELYQPDGGLLTILARYGAAVKKVAAAMEVPVVDIQHAFGEDLAPFRKDGVHPDARGARVIAEQVAQAVAPLLK